MSRIQEKGDWHVSALLPITPCGCLDANRPIAYGSGLECREREAENKERPLFLTY